MIFYEFHLTLAICMSCCEFRPLCNSSTSVCPSNLLLIMANAGYVRNWKLLLGNCPAVVVVPFIVHVSATEWLPCLDINHMHVASLISSVVNDIVCHSVTVWCHCLTKQFHPESDNRI